MRGESRLGKRAGTAAIAIMFGLAACTESGGGPPAAESDDGPTVSTPPATSQTASAAAQPSATVPVRDGKTAADVGIETKGGTFTPLIDRDTVLPTTHNETFTTAEDNQPTINIDVYRGTSDRLADNQRLGRYELTVPNPGPKGDPQLSVTFDIDASGAFRLTATDQTTGTPVTVSALD
ncbi:MAG TPA: Hsp70 family protein [Micromonosporaceae bacterium]|nr:Hsp70 family protein [Micromonosporaceae bacterium]